MTSERWDMAGVKHRGVTALRHSAVDEIRSYPRLHQLDAIRGLLAIGVMVYHLVPGTPTFFGTWGVYGFFVLSGYALDHVYRGRFEIRAFAIARIARLVPLWIPVVLVSAVLYGASPAQIILNLTGAFGFVLPGATSIATGGWSIGIEVVFYCAFPLLVRVSTLWLAVLTVTATAVRLIYTAPLADPLAADWVVYTQPQSFACFFLAGMLGSRLGLLRQGWTGRPARIATALGDASYGIYLLHSLVGPVAPLLALALHPLEVRAGRWIRRPRRYGNTATTSRPIPRGSRP